MALPISSENGLSREEKLEQLDKLLQSRVLQGSESLKAFLRFVVQKAVDGQDTHLKEYRIATEVFGRSSSYDPRVDSVVRVQAGRLRTKIQEYYAAEGKDDPVIIDLPKGHYYPVFSSAALKIEPHALTPLGIEETQDALAPVTTLKILGAPAEESPARAPAKPDYRIIAALLVLAAALAGAALYYRAQANKRAASAASTTDASPGLRSRVAAPLWSDFLSTPDPILIAYSNTLFRGRAETGMKVLKPYDAGGQSAAPPPAPSDAAATQSGQSGQSGPTITDHYTGVGEVMGVYFLGDFLRDVNHSFKVKRSLLMTWDDFKNDNVIMLGSPAENFLLRDFPQSQHFVFKMLTDDKDKLRYGIANLRPQSGEQASYMSKEEGFSTSQFVEDYATISMLRGLDEKRRLLVLAGITTFGTQAAVEYVTKPEYVKELISRLNTSPDPGKPTLPSNYQVLLRVQVKDGVPVQISYVTHHVLD